MKFRHADIIGKSGRTYRVYVRHSYNTWYQIRVYGDERGIFGPKLLNRGHHRKYQNYCSEKFKDNITKLVESVVEDIDIEYRRKDNLTKLEFGTEVA